MLANQEALDNQISEASVKDEETALFRNKNPNKSGEKIGRSSNPLPGKSNQSSGGFRKGRGKRGFHQGGTRHRQENQNKDKTRTRREVVCYKCSKMGHYARECWSKSVEGNVATSVEPESRSEKEWDF